MPGLLRVYIEESEGTAIFIDFMARNFSFDDLSKNTVRHYYIVYRFLSPHTASIACMCRNTHPRQKVLLKTSYFGYNECMNWVRRIFVYLLSITLLVSLLGIALATSIQIGLTHPSKIENWLNQSNLYTNLVSTITDQAQNAIENDVSGGASISKTTIQQAAQLAFPRSLMQQDVQIFLNSNYAWLEGKTPTPNFQIDLSGAKQQFATQVADSAVLAHLKGLPACTAAQTLALQSANPLLLSCLPNGVITQGAATQVSKQVASSGGFLSNPVITASTIGTKGQNSNEPYYEKLSKLPKVYRAIQDLPWILGIIAILSIVGIVFSSRSKRIGLRRVSITFLISGILLIADKLLTDAGFNRLKDKAFSNVNNHQIQQTLTTFAHYVEAELVKIDLWFGIVYLALAVILLGAVLFTRNRRPKSHEKVKPTATPAAPDTFGTHQPRRQPSPIHPDTDRIRSAHISRTSQNLKKRPNRRPPRGLIQ
jgi:hypothetical protein